MKRPVDIRLAVAVRSLKEMLPEVSTGRLIRAAVAVLRHPDPYKRPPLHKWLTATTAIDPVGGLSLMASFREDGR
jgi:hypothetical protein